MAHSKQQRRQRRILRAITDRFVDGDVVWVRAAGYTAEDDLAQLAHSFFLEESRSQGGHDLARFEETGRPVVDADDGRVCKELRFHLRSSVTPAPDQDDVSARFNACGREQR